MVETWLTFAFWFVLSWVVWGIVKRILFNILETYRQIANERERYRQPFESILPEDFAKKGQPVVTIEKISSMFYAYLLPHNRFLAQGNTIPELIEAINERIQEDSFILSDETHSSITDEIQAICQKQS